LGSNGREYGDASSITLRSLYRAAYTPCGAAQIELVRMCPRSN
jgi:hypothetical protein